MAFDPLGSRLLDGIIEIPFPLILLLIGERSGDPPGPPEWDRVGKTLTDNSHIGLTHALDGCPKSCQTSSHDDDIVLEDHFDRSSIGI